MCVRCVRVCVCVCVQHLLIMIKMVLAKLIPDEPDWIRVKREQNEFISMQALGQQVNTHSLTHSHTSLYY